MMATQTLSIDSYQDGQQMQVITELKTEQDPNCSEPDAEGVSPPPVESQTPMDADKQAIYRHPLFPLLALLFEKCEQSTQGSEGTTSASFDVDIENFVRKQEKEGKPFFCEDPETDNLMVKAIQVLRIHLLELEKVNELCKDFCSRYIACLKTKMNSETLLSGEPGSPYSPVQSQQIPSAITGTLSPQGIVVPASALQQGNVTMATVAGGTVYQPVTVVTPQGQVVTQALSPGTVRIQNSQLQLQLNQDLSILHPDDGSSKNKRGVLPKHATNVMRSWLFQHIGHPYPTEDEKKQIAAQTNLTLLQVNNWSRCHDHHAREHERGQPAVPVLGRGHPGGAAGHDGGPERGRVCGQRGGRWGRAQHHSHQWPGLGEQRLPAVGPAGAGGHTAARTRSRLA
ncbi:homeobox protein PKNOX1 isoform X3 [Elephas maximus indicus]|uniref:homeobox protein PKNOX1 isoform X3 n=1 Tax=Elephas maximus indicus TaxID=99487 RepID=UPI0021172B9A|nr:homeobox protein PKNOX1 isoform X3 [Elephas maximus indicus]